MSSGRLIHATIRSLDWPAASGVLMTRPRIRSKHFPREPIQGADGGVDETAGGHGGQILD